MIINRGLKFALLFLTALVYVSPAVRGDILTGCSACDGSRYAITYFLDSDTAGSSTFDVSLLVDTSGNTLGVSKIDAVALGFNGGIVQVAMEFAPNGAANWTAQAGGLNAGGCDGHGAFLCASANADAFAAVTPNAITHTAPYEWTFHVVVPDTTPGGAASIFLQGADVKVHYDSVQGHLVSVGFPFYNATPPSEGGPAPPPVLVPEPSSVLLLGTPALGILVLLRRRFSKQSQAA